MRGAPRQVIRLATPLRLLRVAAWAIGLLLPVAHAGGAQPVAMLDGGPLGQWQVHEWALDVKATAANPYDPEQIAVDGLFTGPAGRTYTMPAFWEIPQEIGAAGWAYPSGEAPGWRLRFAFPAPGSWKLQVRVTTPDGAVLGPAQRLSVTASDAPGPIRVAANRRAFVNSNGDAYFPVGENMGWWDSSPGDYTGWLDRLSGAGGDLIRVWMASWSFAIEWQGSLGQYDGRQAQAAQLDWLFAQAAQRGIDIMLTLNNHGQFSARTNPEWANNPYNAGNGGPLASPQQFFTNAAAQKLFARRLRYVVARWGAYPNLFAWELFNEVDLTDGFDPAAVTAWHRRMAAELKRLDPYVHLVTTSTSNPNALAEVWSLPEIDFSTTHFYGSTDLAAALADLAAAKRRYGKPTLLAEFGPDWRGPQSGADPTGISLHNGLWGPVFGGAAGGGMSWWWDNYIDPLNLYDRFKGLAAFASGVPWDQGDWVPTPVQATGGGLGDAGLAPTLGWGQRPQASDVLVSTGGIKAPAVAQYLYGASYNTQYRPAQPLTFHTDLPGPSAISVQVETAAASGARLVMRLDGKSVLEQPFARQNGDQPVGQSYRIDVPAGRHTVVIDNTGTDWLRVGQYTLAGVTARVRGQALVRSAAHETATSGPVALVWLQDRQHTYTHPETPPVIADARAVVPLPAGGYTVAWYDTESGRILREDAPQAGANGLTLAAPPFSGDVAAKISRRPG